MAKGRKTGGRTVGTPNKRTLDVTQRLAALNCDPLEGMAKIALDETASLELRGRMYAELVGYVYPKRKAIDHSVGGDDGLIDVLLRINGARRT